MLALSAIFFISWYQTQHIYRDPKTLLNKYYRLKQTHPTAAHQALKILLAQDSAYLPALSELGAQRMQALPEPKSLVAPKEFLQEPSKDTPPLFNEHPFTANTPRVIPIQNDLMSIPLKAKERSKKPQAMNQLMMNQLMLLKQAGFLAIQHNRTHEAIDYFSKAYQLSHDPRLAMQLGYLYDKIDDKPKAYHAFKLATLSKNKKRSLCAENNMTSLSGLQTKTLTKPYFSEIFFNPFSQTRFGLTVKPLIARLGVEQTNRLKTREYLFLRRTEDNKSKNLGQLSQIYEDNVQIMGVGGQLTPLSSLPVVAFLETGAAYDLIYRDRNRWRGDLRTGFMYYDEWGSKPAYFDSMKLSTRYYSYVYGEATYFTRYSNVIAGVKTHQGIRLLQYHTSMLNLYATGRMITDTQRQFFNNFAEVGPGIEFVPNNRFNVKVLFEHVHGVYLPAGATPNPYRQYYENTLVQLLFYVKI